MSDFVLKGILIINKGKNLSILASSLSNLDNKGCIEGP